jgi:hypothetical protein
MIVKRIKDNGEEKKTLASESYVISATKLYLTHGHNHMFFFYAIFLKIIQRIKFTVKYCQKFFYSKISFIY